MKRVILIVLGVFLLLFSVPLLVGGVVMAVWAGGGDPTIQGKIGRIESSGSAVVSDTVQVESSWPMADWWDVTVSVQHPNSDTPVFIGYGPTSSVDAYLAGAPYTIVTSIGGEIEGQDGDGICAAADRREGCGGPSKQVDPGVRGRQLAFA